MIVRMLQSGLSELLSSEKKSIHLILVKSCGKEHNDIFITSG